MDHNLLALQQGEGEAYWVLGDRYTFKATGQQTQGAFTLIEQIIQPQNGPPPHIHHQEDEAFYILEGRFAFLSGEQQRVIEKGGFVYIPKGTLHTFKNIDEQPGKLMVLITPAGLETFFYEIGTPATASSTPPAPAPEVFEKVMQLAGQYHMDIVLPGERA